MSENLSASSPSNKIRNLIITVVAIVLSFALVLGSQTSFNNQSLEAQAKTATPLEVALTNQKPTLMEFYANWCNSCQAMAGDLAQLKQQYRDQVNFVMLNVDNSKWLPEILDYNVDGIPHFVFLNQVGKTVAESIGEQPLAIFQGNLQALIGEENLPYKNTQGIISNFNPSNQVQSDTQDDPRAHGQISASSNL